MRKEDRAKARGKIALTGPRQKNSAAGSALRNDDRHEGYTHEGDRLPGNGKLHEGDGALQTGNYSQHTRQAALTSEKKSENQLQNQLPCGKQSQKKKSAKEKRKSQTVYAALDLGTNNCRLLVARPTRRGFLVIDAFSRIIRLGEGVGRTGMLSHEAMARTLDALNICAGKMRRRGVMRSRLVATQACRIAENSADFIDKVREDTGLNLEIISRETEAKLAVSGCASLLDRKCDWALVFDIGGGSSELIWLDLRKKTRPWRRSIYDRLDAQNCIGAWTSLPLGVVTLAEKFGGRDVDQHLFEQMVAYVMEELAEFERQHQICAMLEGGRAHFMGTSGTVTTVAGIHLGLKTYDRASVDGCWLDVAEVRNVSKALLNMSYEARVSQPCVGIERADLVLAGCAILEALLRVWPCERLRVADRGLREGILATLMAEDR